METKMKLGVLLVASFFTMGVYAQGSSKKMKKTGEGGARLSVGAEAGLPIGELSHRYNWNLGLSVQADLPLSEKLYGTLNSGYNNFFGQPGDHDIRLIPIKAGLKYFFVKHMYLQGEAGVAFLTNKAVLNADKSTVFVYAPQFGSLFRLGKNNFIDAGVRYEGNSRFFDGGESNNFVGVRVAYSFGL